jgi:sugar O-acyltransferase (sialic acid O-acetyltransferase NeuD family)
MKNFYRMLHMAQRAIKITADVFLSLAGLVLLSPLFVVIAVLIKLDSTGPVFFRQQRVGKRGKIFSIYKFRTMIENAQNQGKGYLIEKDDFRITKAGKFLRRYSLDELPQLINILQTTMSLVGPRPTLKYQVDQYDERQKMRLNVKPGLTGWAQVHGRNELSWPERIEHDIHYIEQWDLWLDIKIIFKTIGVLLSRHGVYTDNMDKYAVSKKPMREKIFIFGAGGHAKVVIDILRKQKIYEICGIVDDNHASLPAKILNCPVLGGREVLSRLYSEGIKTAIIAIGDNHIRKEIAEMLFNENFQFATAIHPSAVIGEEVRIGRGAVVMANTVINPGTVIGENAIINTSSSIDHDCRIGDFAHICPGATTAGGVVVGGLTLIGMGSSLLPCVTIGSQTIIGAGSVVTADLPDKVTAIGVPARVMELALN